MNNSLPYLVKNNNGYKVMRKIGDQNYNFGFYPERDSATKVLDQVVKCNTDGDAVKLYNSLRKKDKKVLRKAMEGISQSRGIWKSTVLIAGEYIHVGVDHDKNAAEAKYNTAAKLKTLAEVLDFRKANGMNTDGHFRKDKKFLSEEAEKQYNAWLTAQSIKPTVSRKASTGKMNTVVNTVANVSNMSLLDNINSLRAALLSDRERTATKISSIDAKLAKLDHAIKLYNEVASI